MGWPCQEPTPLPDLEVSAFQHLLRVGGVQKLKASRLEIDTIHLFRSVLQDINDADGVKMMRIQRFLVDLHLSMYFSRICLTYRYRPKMKYFRGLKGYCRDSVWVSVLRYDVKEMYRKSPAENWHPYVIWNYQYFNIWSDLSPLENILRRLVNEWTVLQNELDRYSQTKRTILRRLTVESRCLDKY